MGAGRRILVVRRGAFGDTLLLAPVLRALRRRETDARIGFAGVPEFAAVLRHWRLVDDVDLASWQPERCVERIRDYDLVLADDRAVAEAAGARGRTFDPLPRDRRALSVQIASQLDLVLDAPADWHCGVWRGDANGSWWLAPGSGSAAKCWPRQHWLDLAELLAPSGAIAVVVGPTEVERDDPRRWPWPMAVRFVAERTAVQLAEELAAARAFVGNDSGPTHLAAMCGVPTLALFGAGNPAVFAPIGRRVTRLQAPHRDLAQLSPEVVAAALRR
jgi:heptosyltransferase III